jgi:hypothetical protein
MDNKKIDGFLKVLDAFMEDSNFDENVLLIIIERAICEFPSHTALGILEQAKHDYLKMLDEIETEEAEKENWRNIFLRKK